MRNTQDVNTKALLDVLQKEYLVCLLREKIYPKQKHKEFWAKLARLKRDKIIYTKYRLNALCIFDDDRILKQFNDQIFNEYGLPNFYYPNDKVNNGVNIKQRQIYWDIFNWFAAGKNVEFLDENENFKIKKGIIKVTLPDSCTTIIICDEQEFEIKNELIKCLN